MAQVEKTVLVGHSAERMYALVDTVEDYPKFLPWCGGTEVHRESDERVVATVLIDFRGLKQRFTRVTLVAPAGIFRLAGVTPSDLPPSITVAPAGSVTRLTACSIGWRRTITRRGPAAEAPSTT